MNLIYISFLYLNIILNNSVNHKVFFQNQNLLKDTTIVYFISIKGINSGFEALEISKIVRSKDGVLDFLNSSMYKNYYVLKINRIISKSEFISWIGSKYIINVFGVTNKDHIDAVTTSKKGEW